MFSNPWILCISYVDHFAQMLTHPPGSYKPISYEQMYSAVYKWVKKERKPHLLETKNRPSSGVCASSTVKFSTGTSSTTWGVKKKLGIPVRLLESIELIKLTRFTILLPRTRLAQWSSHLSSVQDETFIEEFHKVTISPLIFIIWWQDLFYLGPYFIKVTISLIFLGPYLIQVLIRH